MKYLIFLCLLGTGMVTLGQSQLRSGPMLGHIDSRFANVWLQTKSQAEVQILYWERDFPDRKYTSEFISTRKEHAFAVTIILDSLKSEREYGYTIVLDATPITERTLFFKTPPLSSSKNQPNLKIAMGSCVYINDQGIPEKGGDYGVFQRITEYKPDLMFWLGDNIYMHESDWSSLQGIQQRYTKMRALPEMQELLSGSANYAIWDDHDFGPNDSDRSFINKEQSLSAFKDFWANPSYGLEGAGGITTSFSRGDIDFFLLDNRYFRTPQKRITGERTILGKEQLEWLIDALSFSEASYKIVLFGGLILSSNTNPLSQNYIANFKEERNYLLNEIHKNKIENVIFLTGDKHFTDLSKVNRKGSVIWELTTSPLTAPPNVRPDMNKNRIEGTFVQQRNFSVLEISGDKDDRRVSVGVYDAEGLLLWKKVLDE
jgi:alkaline phosphatase D